MTTVYSNADDGNGGSGSEPSHDVQPAPSTRNLQSEETSDHAWERHRFRLLYEANHDDLWRYCLRRANSTADAEEVLAETLLIAWRRLAAVPNGDDARPWLFGVARNQLRNGWRKNKRTTELGKRLIAAHTENHAPDPADAIVDTPSDLLTSLSTLREKDQEILRLVAWEELSHAQIAIVLGCSENAVAIRVHRARNRLEKAIAKRDRSAKNRSNRENVKAPETSTHVGDTSPTTRKEA